MRSAGSSQVGELVLAARRLELHEVPAVIISDLSEAELRALRVALNRLGEEAEWNSEELQPRAVGDHRSRSRYRCHVSGFETAEIDVMLGGGADEEDEVPPVETETVPVSRPGDLWMLGAHRVFCGDALKEESYRQALGAARAQLVFTDPPYNVPIEGHVSGLGAVTHQEFAMASGEMSSAEFQALPAALARPCVLPFARRSDPFRVHGLAPHERAACGRS